MVDELAILLNDKRGAALLGISKATLWRHVQGGLLPSPIKIGGSTRWRRDQLVAAVEAATQRSPAARRDDCQRVADLGAPAA